MRNFCNLIGLEKWNDPISVYIMVFETSQVGLQTNYA